MIMTQSIGNCGKNKNVPLYLGPLFLCQRTLSLAVEFRILDQLHSQISCSCVGLLSNIQLNLILFMNVEAELQYSLGNQHRRGKSNTLSKGNKQQQQQDAAFTENNVDGFASCDHQKKNRSLDTSSLLNVLKVTEDCRPSCVVE